MVPYFGRHGSKQFIRGKTIRWGYKFWMATTISGYIEWFEPYQGASTKLEETILDWVPVLYFRLSINLFQRRAIIHTICILITFLHPGIYFLFSETETLKQPAQLEKTEYLYL